MHTPPLQAAAKTLDRCVFIIHIHARALPRTDKHTSIQSCCDVHMHVHRCVHVHLLISVRHWQPCWAHRKRSLTKAFLNSISTPQERVTRCEIIFSTRPRLLNQQPLRQADAKVRVRAGGKQKRDKCQKLFPAVMSQMS